MFTGTGTPLTQKGLDSLARELSVPLPALWAVLAVETSGCGFTADRRPLILFERHWFSKLTKGRFDSNHPDISNRTPGGYGNRGVAQYARLERAVALDRKAALQSTSWGLGQVMGFNAETVGFANFEEMVKACMDSEDGQMRAMCGFITSANLSKRLREKDWAGFAFRYNGTDFQKNKYDEKLATFNARFEVGPLPDLNVRWAQMSLMYLGYITGGVDGWFGAKTQAALMRFQKDRGIAQSGAPDQETTAELSEALKS
ncbi:MAG: N-acetylmuramidase domain-containing protein [Gemmatimonadaceae bacterium]